MGDFDYMSSSIQTLLPEGNGYISVHPEMYPTPDGISPTGDYYVYMVHSKFGSCSFRMEQDEDCTWICMNKPPFISPELLAWIGQEIESHTS